MLATVLKMTSSARSYSSLLNYALVSALTIRPETPSIFDGVAIGSVAVPLRCSYHWVRNIAP